MKDFLIKSWADQSLFIFALGLCLIGLMIRAIRRGKTYDESGMIISRQDKPTSYWFEVIGSMVMGFAGLGIAIYMWLRR